MKSIAEIVQEFKSSAPQYDIPYHWFEGLMLDVIKKNKVFLMTDGDYVLSADEYERYQSDMVQLQQGVPLPYILGVMDFWGRSFCVNEHTLIPRPDTEILVETVLDFVKSCNLDAGAILDLGTGSGCIAITLAKELPNFGVVAVDNSVEALQIAQQNAKNLKATNCQFVLSDWFGGVCGQKFDIIVSNPPYIAPEDEHLVKLTHEPITALVGEGDDGLSDIWTIAQDAVAHLSEGGLLAVEHGYDQGVAVQDIFKQFGYQDIKTLKDYGDNDRVTLGRC